MTDSTQQTGSGTPGLGSRAEVFDVLIRGLEMARRTSHAAADDEGPVTEGPVELFCTYAYAEVGTLFCPLFYYHA
ncbi:hypothetical protein GCM10009836_33170 [Pseudonocardia ailaonensis]|uniref:Uncharacterized protein n=1 Tax=Pseudonocardia ailaonensis TaxID=367279 RepID=A0ABN2N390_9PSEU